MKKLEILTSINFYDSVDKFDAGIEVTDKEGDIYWCKYGIKDPLTWFESMLHAQKIVKQKFDDVKAIDDI